MGRWQRCTPRLDPDPTESPRRSCSLHLASAASVLRPQVQGDLRDHARYTSEIQHAIKS